MAITGQFGIHTYTIYAAGTTTYYYPGILQAYYGSSYVDLPGQIDTSPPTLSANQITVKDDGTYLSLRWRDSHSNYFKMNLGRAGTIGLQRGATRLLSAHHGIEVSDGTYAFTARNTISQFYVDASATTGNTSQFAIGDRIVIHYEATQAGSVKLYDIDASGTETLIIPQSGTTEGQNLSANTLYQFPPSGARYSFTVAPPRGISAVRAEYYSTSNQTGTILDTAYLWYIAGT